MCDKRIDGRHTRRCPSFCQRKVKSQGRRRGSDALTGQQAKVAMVKNWNRVRGALRTGLRRGAKRHPARTTGAADLYQFIGAGAGRVERPRHRGCQRRKQRQQQGKAQRPLSKQGVGKAQYSAGEHSVYQVPVAAAACGSVWPIRVWGRACRAYRRWRGPRCFQPRSPHRGQRNWPLSGLTRCQPSRF